jgi:tetratricopeptide (TPR) repeat protein
MGSAIKSFSRVGYRFCTEAVVQGPKSGEMDAEDRQDGSGTHSDLISAARRAVAAQLWAEAASLYQQVRNDDFLRGDDLDRWALALECLGTPSEAIPVLTRAVMLHALEGSDPASARSALVLSRIHLERGEMAVCRGWLARSQLFLGEKPECSEYGLLLWMQARVASIEEEAERALNLADRAYEVGRQTRDPEVQSLGLMYRGFYRLCLGETHEGQQDQDHAAALALSSGVDPVTGSTIYCNILWACRTFGDWARAHQWTISYQTWCTSSRMGYSGACKLHRAEALGFQGSLRDALAHVTDALARLPDDAPWALGDAHRVLGDIHAMIGDEDAAMNSYETAFAFGWDAEPGHAMLLLERGQAGSALASLERSLVGNGWWTLQRRGILLAHLALVAAWADSAERVKAFVDELNEQSERWPMPSIRALTNEAIAVLAIRGDRPQDAVRHLHLARQLWTSIEARYQAARLRIRIAGLLLELRDGPGAATELRIACAAAGRLGSYKLEDQCAVLRRSLIGSEAST